MTDVRWTCPACKVAVTTPYCGLCGEEPLQARDLTIRGLAEKIVHALTDVDARVARSAWKLLRNPGELTRAWASGIRKPYVAPFQLFLLANVLFFAIQWATGENVFSSTLDSHLHHQDWSQLAQSALTDRLAETQQTRAQYQPTFDRAVVLNAKSLIVLMTVPFTLLLPLVFLRERRPFMTHVTFSLHLYTFLLLLFCVALLASGLGTSLGVGGLDTPIVDNVLSIANVLVCALYLFLAIGPVYGATGVRRVGQTAILVLSVAAIVLGYRFALFFITLYGT
jgi:hypothetical protein